MKRLTLVFSLLLLVCYSFADMQHVTCEEIKQEVLIRQMLLSPLGNLQLKHHQLG